MRLRVEIAEMCQLVLLRDVTGRIRPTGPRWEGEVGRRQPMEGAIG